MFGKYKQSITDTLVSNYTNKKLFKESFHSLMNGLRENKIAREFFVLYGEIENKRFDDKQLAEEYLNAVIKTLKDKKSNLKIPTLSEQENSGTIISKILEKIKKGIYKEITGMEEAELAKYLENLSEDEREKVKEKLNDDAKKYIDIVLSRAGKKVGKAAGKSKESMEENKIYSKLDSLIFNESVKTIEKNLINKRNLISHLTRPGKNLEINETVSTSILSTLITNKFNEKYKSLSEEESKKFKKYLELDKKSLSEEFTTSQNEVLNKLNTLKESSEDKNVIGKLDSVIEQLTNPKVDRVSLYKLNKLKKELE